VALAALPLTSGYFSKDQIVLAAYQQQEIGPWLWAGAITGAFLTALYSFRLVFIVFFGEAATEPDRTPGWRMGGPLLLLCALSLLGGWIAPPLAVVFPAPSAEHPSALIEWVSIGVPLLGLLLAYLLFLGRQFSAQALVQSRAGQALHHFWQRGWAVDALYEFIWVAPYRGLTRLLRGEPVDLAYNGVVRLSQWLHARLSDTQTGRMRWYATAMAAGVIVMLGVILGAR